MGRISEIEIQQISKNFDLMPHDDDDDKCRWIINLWTLCTNELISKIDLPSFLTTKSPQVHKLIIHLLLKNSKLLWEMFL
jgi:hypothetical protein